MKISKKPSLPGSIHVLLAMLSIWITACGQPAVPAADPGAIVAEGQLGTPLLLANGQSTVYARIRLTTLARPERARGPINIAVAMDTSGSMEGTPIEEARKAALEMIDSLRDGDRLAVIAFHTKTEVLLPSTALDGEARAKVRKRVSEMRAEGTTDMSGGLDWGLGPAEAAVGRCLGARLQERGVATRAVTWNAGDAAIVSGGAMTIVPYGAG